MENDDDIKTTDEFEAADFDPPIEVKKMEKLTRLLSSLQAGWKVAILRQQPSWCKGHLETIEIYNPGDEGSQIDVNYLIREWGGQLLFLKIHDERGKWVGGGAVSLFSYPPKVHGKVLREPDYTEILNPAPQTPPWPYPYPPPQQTAAPTLDFGKLLDIVMKQKNSDPAMLLKVLELQQQAQQRQAPPMSQNPLEQMMGMLSLFREMRGVFGELAGVGGGGGGGDDGGMMPMIAEVVKGLMAKQNQPLPQRRVLSPPRQAPNMAGHDTAQPLPPTQSVDESNRETLGSIADKLARLAPDDAAEVVLTALGNMPEQDRSRAMTAFLSQMNEDEDLDEQSTMDDNSIDEPVNPNTQILGHAHPIRSTRR